MNPWLKTPSAIWATTDFVSLGSGWAREARKLIPRNIVTAIAPMIPRVSAALRAWGRRKAGTPFEMASTPVSAVDPEENACRITKMPTAPAVPMAKWSAGGAAWAHPLVTHFARPVATRM